MPQFSWLKTQESLSLAQMYALNQVPQIQTHKSLFYARRVTVTEEREPDALNSLVNPKSHNKQTKPLDQGRTRSRKRIAVPMSLL